MITIMKKDFPAFVNDFAGTYKAKPNDIVAVCFDDKKRQAYMIDVNNKKIIAFKPVFYSIWYNMGNRLGGFSFQILTINIYKKSHPSMTTTNERNKGN